MIKKNVLLSGKTTFGIGGKADYYTEISGKQELAEVLRFIKEKDRPFLILGGGSNVLVSDGGFRGLVV